MVSAAEIGYEVEIQENVSIDDIRKEYTNGVIVWINGSGKSPDGKAGSYRCVLDYMGHVKYLEKQLPDATANQAMITGAIDAVQCVNKPLRLYLVSPTALGFVNGLKGKGPNGALIQQLCEIVKERNCKLTEVQFSGGSDAVKKFIYSCNPDKSQIDELERKQEKKKNRYKKMLYDECLSKVVQILQENDVEKAVIEAIMNIRP